ncbi:MAG TPA: hypothetical protein VK706_02090 [Candidatus Sulfotelmatobacter sp.]|jgi:hypothetical protein|nr:hypothetical protein [Candidatus Sulfotelmatobacter sp.]
MKSERNKESGENLYSTGFVAFANGLPAKRQRAVLKNQREIPRFAHVVAAQNMSQRTRITLKIAN